MKGGALDERAIRVRRADAADLLDVLRILDGAMLETDADRVSERIEAGSVLVATVLEDGEVVGVPVGALVRDGDRVTAVATRRRHRDRGVGSALVRAALAGRDHLVAEFDPCVRPFYESLGFDIEAAGDGRLRGRLEG
ncbi:GNAT family N-acetyltransferase [Haloplanus natans]